ncbi:hypothetical protein NC653_041871 [Populus alba x Populus x berolinensis]|uniref:Uncharacterized protein n=1 Tax=Populus alba x Populus x berolinensis TaxID=444605 RepID=A0AAD6LB56_9ROSI|nr:hypothetical protein NC653_041862 [Populus alba x Populus x berolinensis]KAJ6952857.1 hypothetical protein NC653_041871 [Populus alba x Populus x berolinensis]
MEERENQAKAKAKELRIYSRVIDAQYMIISGDHILGDLYHSYIILYSILEALSAGINTTGKGMVLGAKRLTTLPSGTHEHSHMGSEIGHPATPPVVTTNPRAVSLNSIFHMVETPAILHEGATKSTFR